MIYRYLRLGLRAIITLGKIFVVIILVVHLLPIFSQVFLFLQHAASYIKDIASHLSSFLSSLF